MRAEAGRQQAVARGRTLQPWMWALAGLIIGLAIGIYYAWMIDPVEWTDADPVDLSQRWKESWTLMAVDSYSIRQNDELAREWFSSFSEEERRNLLAQLHGAANVEEERQKVQALATALGVDIGAPTTLPEEEAEQPPPEEAAEEGGGLLRTLLTVCAVGLLIILLLLVVARVIVSRRRDAGELRERPRRERETAGAYQAPTPQRPAPPADEETASFDLDAQPGVAQAEEDLFDEAFFEEELADEPRPDTGAMPAISETSLGQFTTRYQYGDDHFDMSFSIETSDTTFLGECGVSVSEVLDEDPHQHVTAFEVWLFDKDDILTVTKILMTPHAWENDALRSRLRDRGELVALEQGETFDLETESLRVRVRVREVEYGTDSTMPDESYVEWLELELEPYHTDGTGGEGSSIEY